MQVPVPELNRIRLGALAAGIIALLLIAVGALLSGLGQLFQSYLYAYMFWLGITLGSLAIALLYLMVGGGWGLVIRRVSEAASKTLWLSALLFIPLLFGLQYLYPWAKPELVASDPLLQHKSLYLNVPFTIARAVLYFAIWGYLVRGLSYWSHHAAMQADAGDRRRFQRFSAFGIILYFLTMTFASVDWVMSLQPDWLSTIYGMLIVVGQALSGLAFALMLLPLLIEQDRLAEVLTPRHYRDLGALLLTSVMLWAYLAFSQYLIIWYGNLPHEASWYLARTTGGWQWIGLVILLFQFALPFTFLISLRAKRNPRVLTGLAILIILVRLGEWFWEVIPAFHPGNFAIHWLDLVTPVAIGGLWLAAFLWHYERTPWATGIGSSQETA